MNESKKISFQRLFGMDQLSFQYNQNELENIKKLSFKLENIAANVVPEPVLDIIVRKVIVSVEFACQRECEYV